LSEEVQPQIRTFYANGSEVHHSKQDFCITFSVDSPSGTKTLFAVLTPPEAAKVLLRILEANVNSYEQEYRKIEEPKLITTEDKKSVEKEKPIYR
jgi:hypothetical protein